MKRIPYSLRLLALAVLLALPPVGCGSQGPETYPVTGRITYQGKPVPTGNVSFVPDKGPMAAAAIGADGTYRLSAVAGRHRVAVVAMPPPPPGRNLLQNPEGYVPPAPLVPAKYGRPATSPLTADVRPDGPNVIDFDLQ